MGVFFSLALILQVVLAQNAPMKGQGVTISPYLNELDVNPGDVKNLHIQLSNPTDSLVELYPKVMNFRASGEGGDPNFYPATDENRGYSMAHWIVFEQTKIAILPNQIVDFDYTIKIPEDAEPGGHYGVMFFSTEPPKIEEKTSAVAIASMTGSLILVRVSGNTQEEGFLEEFSVARKFYWKTPVNFALKIKNSGNVHFRPKGEIVLRNIFGNEAGKTIINSKLGNVLPDSTRKFEESFNSEKILIGPFSANLRVIYGESEKTLAGKVEFWIVPWWSVLILGLILLLILIFIIRKIFKKRKGGKGGFGGGAGYGREFEKDEKFEGGGRIYFEERARTRMETSNRERIWPMSTTQNFRQAGFPPKRENISPSRGPRRVV